MARFALRHTGAGKWGVGQVVEAVVRLEVRQMVDALLMSAMRYVAFSTLYYLMLKAFGVTIGVSDAVIVIPVIYLLTTVTHTITASEAVVRRSYSMVVIAPFFSSSLTVGCATSVLMVVNNLVQMLLGSLLFKLKNARFNSVSPGKVLNLTTLRPKKRVQR